MYMYNIDTHWFRQQMHFTKYLVTYNVLNAMPSIIYRSSFKCSISCTKISSCAKTISCTKTQTKAMREIKPQIRNGHMSKDACWQSHSEDERQSVTKGHGKEWE